MNTKIIILFSLMFTCCIYSQQWVNNYDFPSTEITQIQFINPNTGWITTQNQNTIKIWKTVNKGVGWTDIKTFTQYAFVGSATTYLLFINQSTGYMAYVPTDRTYTIVEKTTDGGSNWTRKVDYSIVPLALHPLLVFTSSLEGYLFTTVESNPSSVKVYKTIDGFENYSLIHTESPPYQTSFQLNDLIKDVNNNLVGIGWNKHTGYQFTDAFRFTYYGIFNRAYGVENTYLKYLYGAFINSVPKYLGVQEQTNSTYPGTRFYPDFAYQQSSIQIDPQNSITKVGGLSFSNDSKGFVSVGNKVYITNNSGNNWTVDGTLASDVYSYIGHHMVKSFGDVCYAASGSGKFNTRKISGNYNTMFDWQSGNGSIAVDGVNIGTPSNGYFRGGNTALYANQYLLSGGDTTVRFYYWGGDCNGSMNWNNSYSYLINSGSNINADYKTKLKSTIPEALKNANQTKALKDTNGVTNLIYESMGGIFYTRTRPDGQFKTEEVVSGSSGSELYGQATFGNSNPYLVEIKSNNPESNIVACWERREGSNIKIMIASRSVAVQNRLYWALIDSITIVNMPQDFKCLPKIMISGNTKAITYLKPATGTNVKLAAIVMYQNNQNRPELEVIAGTNLQEYAITALPSSPGISNFIMHLAYRVGQTIYHKKCFIGWDGPGPRVYNIDEPVNISTENSRWRASLDIALKNTANNTGTYNMQPVITYQGRFDVRIMIDNEDGPPIELPGTYYPIYVKERLSGGGWSSSVISYNSPVNTIQQTPNIEGAKHMNSCILNYTKIENGLNKNLQVVPRWNNTAPNTFFCEPNTYIGTDAKIIKSGLINNSSATQKLMTLSSSGNIHTLNTQSFNITNVPSGGIDGNIDEISGVVENNDVKYSFNLGNIMVNFNNIGFSSDIDTVIDNSGDLNKNMVSKTFSLNENDTLIIGRNANYMLEDPNGIFTEIEYWVKLMNKSTNLVHRLLAHDTLHITDSLQIEYLEGYIIRNIPNGNDSFFVQLEIDTVDGNFGIGGGIGGDGASGGDNIQGKRKIYWENEKISNGNNNIPTSFNLYQNFPNPFNPATVIKYDLPKDVKVTVKVYDLLGREVTTLVNNEYKIAGRYELNWNASQYSSGVYIYRIEARQVGSLTGVFVSTKKMVLVK